MILALATGFAVGFIVLMVYFAGHGAGYVKGRNDYIEALEWVLLNDPVARRDLVEGLEQQEKSNELQGRIDGYRQAAKEQRN